MAYVITEPCSGVKDGGCVTVCPCDCIQPGTLEADGKIYDQFFIDPDHCIDCGLCETECPVNAVFADVDVPKPWQHLVALNADFFHRTRATDAQD
ncbi:MAG TPA: 4Fe-4S binding protein [Chthonomonadaceae bacterium]|nr:4Fe-4S binding protein [Chthonomonadaceae bacterium]